MNSFAHLFAEETGAAGIHLRFAAPAYKFLCHMGMDTHDTSRLISRNMNPREIARMINMAESSSPSPNILSVGFNDPDRVQQATTEALIDPWRVSQFGKLCTACADGNYPIKVNEPAIIDLAMPTKRVAKLAVAHV